MLKRAKMNNLNDVEVKSLNSLKTERWVTVRNAEIIIIFKKEVRPLKYISISPVNPNERFMIQHCRQLHRLFAFPLHNGSLPIPENYSPQCDTVMRKDCYKKVIWIFWESLPSINGIIKK